MLYFVYSRSATGVTGRATLRANVPTWRTAEAGTGAAAGWAAAAEAGGAAGLWTTTGMEAVPSVTGTVPYLTQAFFLLFSCFIGVLNLEAYKR